VLAVALLAGCGGADPASPPGGDPPRFVGRATCVTCHAAEAQMHAGSDHDLAMQPATPVLARGGFDRSFEHAGVRTRFFERRGDLFVRTEASDGGISDFPVAYVFGARPLEQYLLELPGGRLQAFGIAWDTRPATEGGERWFHLYPDDVPRSDDPLHWTGPLQNWNHMCAECHSTGVRKNYRPVEDRFETRWAEIDVSCEACHGPGSRHVAWALGPGRGSRRAGADPGEASRRAAELGLLAPLRDTDGGVWRFEEGEPTARRSVPRRDASELETCGRCHSRRARVRDDYRHGDPLAQTHRVALLEERLYHADGQILDEVFVYGSFVQSRMHREGVSCKDCHDPHSGGVHLPGNALCAKCHAPSVFDTPAHHHHPPGSAGASCVECHMPARTYMQIDPRRDHGFRVPRPDLTRKIGVPNACNDCHGNRDVAWAEEATRRWYGSARAGTFHFGEALHAARERSASAPELLRRAIEDPETPGIARATAVAHLRAHPGRATLGILEGAASDPDPLVRRAAASVLDDLDPASRLRLGARLLDDPMRTVRLEAVPALAALAGPAGGGLPAGLRDPFGRALAEYRESLRTNADRSESWVARGDLEARLGHAEEAEAAYDRAISLDPSYLPAHVNLADLLRVLGRDDEGEEILRAALRRDRDDAAAHHALGLLRVRLGDREGALEHLERAAELRPGAARYRYVHAVALHDAGRPAEAIAQLESALADHPRDEAILGALVAYSRAAGRDEEAWRYARRLEALAEEARSPARRGTIMGTRSR